MAKPTSIHKYDIGRLTLSNSVKVRLGALGASLAVLTALVVMATGVTGAYFSETKQGEIKAHPHERWLW